MGSRTRRCPRRSTRRACTGCSCGWRCRRRSVTANPASSTTRTSLSGRTATRPSPSWPGWYGSAESPASVHTPLVAVEMVLPGPGSHRLALEPTFEYGILTMSGAVDVGDATVTPGSLLYLAPGRSELTVEAPGEARVVLL